MTPMAKQILRAAFEPQQRRDLLNDEARAFAESLLGAHCFEVSALAELAQSFWDHHFPHHIDYRLMFLPSQHTWLEASFELPEGRGHTAISLIDRGDGYVVGRMFSRIGSGKFPPMAGPVAFRLGRPTFEVVAGHKEGDRGLFSEFLQIQAACLLTLINQPSGIERRAEQVHRGFEREIRRSGVLSTGKLLPWTRLVIAPPRPVEAMEGAGETGRLNGSRKCYHFVRAHFRAANGQFVKAHFRGDPALGIGRKTYLLKAA